jgi:sialic acid synthase SpsE
MNKTYIIAEMAWGYTGNYNNSLKILNGVKESGADAIGIHITNLSDYMVKDYKCNAGQTLSDSADDEVPIYEYLDKINMKNDDWIEFGVVADRLNIDLVVMCNDISSFEFSRQLRVKKYVVSAAIFLELDLIQKMVEDNNDIVLRIGGATLKEIENVVDFIFSIDKMARINLLVGIQLYPTPIDQLHIASINTLKSHFNNPKITFGLADHIDGDSVEAIYLPSIALAFGVTTIEKHITTDREEKMEDYEAALGIVQFNQFVNFIRKSEKALGCGNIDYLVNDSYQKYRSVVRKKLVATKDFHAGHIISKNDISFKRSDKGGPIEDINKIIGKTLLKDLKKDQGLCEDNFV